MKKNLRSIARLATLTLCILGLLAAGAAAGIRMDGTEFQSGSKVSTTQTTTVADGSVAGPSGTDRKLVYTMGQAVLAYGSIQNSSTGQAVKIGLGYDFNAQQKTDFGCTCNHQGDANIDGQKDGLDLTAVIDALFYGGLSPQDPLCPLQRFDTDCDGYLTILDFNQMIDQLFYGGPPPCNPCFGL